MARAQVLSRRRSGALRRRRRATRLRAHDEGARLHLHLDVGGVAEDVAVELDLLLVVDPHLDRLAAVAVQGVGRAAALGEHPGRHGQPRGEALRRDDDDVQRAVVRLGIRHEVDAAGEPAAVADEDGAGPHRRGGPAVDRELGLEPLDEEVLQAGGHVGRPPDPRLEALRGVVHDRGVEPEPGHDEERVPPDAGRRALADALLEVRLLRVELEPPDVDVPVASGDGDLDGAAEVVGRQLEVAGEQVARAPGEQPHRHAGAHHLLGDRADGAVAAEGADDVDLRAERITSLAEADVVLGGLEEQRLGPAVTRADPRDDVALVVAVTLELRRVEHDPHAPTGRSGGLRVIAAERVAGRSGAGCAAATACRQHEPEPRPHEHHRQGDPRPDPPSVRHRVERTARREPVGACVVFTA